MFSPEGGLCNNNSRHDKREHMWPYRAYTLQRITALPSSHGLTGWRDGGVDGEQRGRSGQGVACLSGGGFSVERIENWGRK